MDTYGGRSSDAADSGCGGSTAAAALRIPTDGPGKAPCPRVAVVPWWARRHGDKRVRSTESLLTAACTVGEAVPLGQSSLAYDCPVELTIAGPKR